MSQKELSTNRVSVGFPDTIDQAIESEAEEKGCSKADVIRMKVMETIEVEA